MINNVVKIKNEVPERLYLVKKIEGDKILIEDETGVLIEEDRVNVIVVNKKIRQYACLFKTHKYISKNEFKEVTFALSVNGETSLNEIIKRAEEVCNGIIMPTDEIKIKIAI